MYYGWTTTRLLHEERVKQFTQPTLEDERVWPRWRKLNLGALLKSVYGRLARLNHTPAPRHNKNRRAKLLS